MNRDTLTVLTAGIQSLPPLPAVVTRVMETTADPDSSINDLMAVIRPDQSLTVKILKVANSAYYSPLEKIASLKQAVMLLGFEEIRNLVLATALFNNTRRLPNIDSFDIRQFWNHVFLTGLAAKGIAGKLSVSGGELFVAGLVHDIGKLIICMALPQAFAEVVHLAGPNNLHTYDAELAILGTTHQDIGMQLLKRWRFPRDLIVAAGCHHTPDALGKTTPVPIIIHLADIIAHMDMAPDDTRNLAIDNDAFPPGIVSLAKANGMEWNQDARDKYLADLAVQKEAQSGVLDLFLL